MPLFRYISEMNIICYEYYKTTCGRCAYTPKKIFYAKLLMWPQGSSEICDNTVPLQLL